MDDYEGGPSFQSVLWGVFWFALIFATYRLVAMFFDWILPVDVVGKIIMGFGVLIALYIGIFIALDPEPPQP